MEQKDLKEFAKTLICLVEIFEPQGKVSPLRTELYFQHLKEYSIEDIEKAAQTLIRTRIFNGLPKPSEIIEAINGSENDRALKAWTVIHKALMGPPGCEIEDPVSVKAISAMGGWGVLSRSTEDQLRFLQREFERLYTLYSKTQRFDEIGHKAVGRLPEKVKGIVARVGHDF